MAAKTTVDGPEIIITIHDGKMDVNGEGFIGMECAGDAMLKALKKMGLVSNLRRKRDGDTRPVHDANVVDVGI